jgi:hypothetical protein
MRFTSLVPAFFLLLVACGPVPPDVPVLGGGFRAQPAETLEFWAVTHDRNRGNLSYWFEWGDSSIENWSAERSSGETLYRAHSYAQPGDYPARVKARDEEGYESGWSAVLKVQVGFLGPERPMPPSGPVLVRVDTLARFEVAAGHVRGESVSVRFDWGDTLGDWSGFVASGQPVTDSHLWSEPGEYDVRCRARDRAGTLSPWSDPLAVRAEPWPLEPPSGLRLRSSSGLLVRLDWNIGRNRDPVRYGVWFRPVGTEQFNLVDTVAGSGFLHDPLGETGDYTLTASLDTQVLACAETASTVPVLTDSTILDELNVGLSALGWDRASGTGARLPMTDTASAARADCYLTDRGPGHSGPSFLLASPDLGPEDPGGVVPEADWHRSWMLLLWGSGQEPLPEFDSLAYESMVDVSLLEHYLALFTEDGYYCLVRTFGPDPGTGKMPVMAWFQPVRGLRLLKHPDPTGGN